MEDENITNNRNLLLLNSWTDWKGAAKAIKEMQPRPARAKSRKGRRVGNT